MITVAKDRFIFSFSRGGVKMDEYLIGKTATVVWEVYLAICKQGFVLDEEMDWILLEKEFAKIKEFDLEIKVYACTYPIEKTDNGMHMYCDNLWLKTRLNKKQIAEIFSEYRRIEPYSISELTEDEKESVDIYMGNETQYCNFADALHVFKNQNVISMYWD